MKKIKYLFVSLLLLSPVYAEEPNVSMFQPLPESAPNIENPSSADKIALGKKLYFETALSQSQQLSCNSCHRLDTYGVDNQARSPGHNKQLGDRNSPTVYNAALHVSQFWDGRAKDLEAQALGPMMNPKEMAMPSEAEVIRRLSDKADYKEMFEKAFPGEEQPLTFQNVGKAIGAFERTLLLPSRFDDYLRGDKQALSDNEKRGLKKFVETGCVACHMGSTLGGQMYQKLGLVIPYTQANKEDLGRAKISGNPADLMVFKVPSLRNVEKTAPYFHDGHVATLQEAVKIMGKHQLGKDLSASDVEEIVDFLKSLTGVLPQNKS